MITRSRLWTSLAVAFTMVLTTGLGVAGPAAAEPSEPVDVEIEAADASGLGAMLSVSYEERPDGYVRTTEYENTTVTQIQAASCQITVSANRPVKSGSQIRGSGNMKLGGANCSGTWQVLLHVEIYSVDWIPVKTLKQTVYAPYSGYFSTATTCKKGTWRSEIIVQRGSENEASRSNPPVTVSSC